MQLIAYLSTGKGTWGHVSHLISNEEWEDIILVTNDFGKENFTPEKKAEFIIVDSSQALLLLTQEIQEKLKDKIKGTEVALNIVSGTGKEHMALLSALLKLGVGIRLKALTKDGVKEL
ncbi:hypothetical protein CL618_00190 [archaeon]|nr:hypothetical protein [archaeon]|tara:strand:+ start:1082 stop:1435 length:354 start_codon:yes stop_codon:yes gene_type:complete